MKLVKIALIVLAGAGLSACTSLSSISSEELAELKKIKTISLDPLLDYRSFVRMPKESSVFAHQKTVSHENADQPQMVELARQSFENRLQAVAAWRWRPGSETADRQPAALTNPETLSVGLGPDALAKVKINYRLKGFTSESGYGPAVIEAASVMEIVNRHGKTVLTLRSTQQSDDSTEMIAGNVIFDSRTQKMFRQATEKTADHYKNKIEDFLKN